MLRAKDNPFSTDRVLRQRYRFSGVTSSSLHARLRLFHYRAALVGLHGSGKTTLIEDLAQQLETVGWQVHLLRLSEEVRAPCGPHFRGWTKQLSKRDFVLLDGAEQLSWWRWQSFRVATRHAGGMIVTTHLPGRLPTLHRCETSPGLLVQLTAALGEPLSLDEAAELHTRYSGNLREALRELYERAALRPS